MKLIEGKIYILDGNHYEFIRMMRSVGMFYELTPDRKRIPCKKVRTGYGFKVSLIMYRLNELVEYKNVNNSTQQSLDFG